MVKVSIIVPIFNKEKYLLKCINSLVNQSLKDIEVILVNDGSVDRSRAICEEIVKNDKRFKLINKKNGGVSSARNAGINNAVGSYITFVDPDDYLDNDAIEYLYDLINRYNAEIACYKAEVIREDNISNNDRKEEIKVYYNEEILKEQIQNNRFSPCCWNKLYSREIFNNTDFRFREDIRYAEDELLNMYILSDTKSLVKSNLRKYNYFIHEDSTVAIVNEKRLDVLRTQVIMFEFFKKNHPYLTKYIIEHYIKASICIAVDIVYTKSYESSEAWIDEFKKLINENKEIAIYNDRIKFLDKVKFEILKKNPKLLVYIYKMVFFVINKCK